MGTNKIRFVVLGYGHIGKRHAAMINANEECELVGICDIAGKDCLKGEVLTIPLFTDSKDIYNSGLEFDVLSIATPNGLHEEQALEGIRNGHHVVIEKPMALTKKGCENILYAALHKNKQVFCVMQNRYSPPSVWIKDLLHNNILGKIFLVQINCYWNRDDRYYTKKNWHGKQDLDGGTLFTQFSHFVDIMYWLFGDITNIKARFEDFNHKDLTDFEDSGIITFDFNNGGIGSFSYSTAIWDKNLESSITIIAERGTVKIGGQYMNEVEACHIKDYHMPQLPPSNPPNDYGPYKGSAANHHYIFDNVVNVLKGREAITTNALEGMKVVDIIERIYSLKK